jgi:hypothetical protein
MTKKNESECMVGALDSTSPCTHVHSSHSGATGLKEKEATDRFDLRVARPTFTIRRRLSKVDRPYSKGLPPKRFEGTTTVERAPQVAWVDSCRTLIVIGRDNPVRLASDRVASASSGSRRCIGMPVRTPRSWEHFRTLPAGGANKTSLPQAGAMGDGGRRDTGDLLSLVALASS